MREGLPQPYEMRFGDLVMPIEVAGVEKNPMAPVDSVCILNRCDVCRKAWAPMEWVDGSAVNEQLSICLKCQQLGRTLEDAEKAKA